MKIRFDDYFKVSMPRHKRLSELDRDNAVYLPTGLIMDEICNYVNNKSCFEIPKDILNNILVVELQRYDKMIDVDGNEFDWSDDGYAFSPRNPKVGGTAYDDIFEKKISAVNNMFLNDVIDIEASIIYNLIEIRPIQEEVSLDF